MNVRSAIVAFALTCFVQFLPGPGKAQQYNFINYSIENGLAQTQVETLFQDHNGFIWIGTLGGLSRFDGINFTNFSIENGLLSNEIESITEDQNGHIWVGTLGGICHFDGRRFTSFQLADSLIEKYIKTMAFDRDGNLWCGTDGKGVVRFKDGKFSYFNKENGLPHNTVREIICDANGKVWAATRGGLSYWENEGFQQIGPEEETSISISGLFEDNEKNLWFTTFGKGIYRYDGNEFTNFRSDQGLISDWIRSGAEDMNGNFWFSSKFGICKYDGQGFTSFDSRNGLLYPNIGTTLVDKEGNLWLGTAGKGLLKFTGEAFVSLTSTDGLSNDIVMSIVEDHENNFWFSTYGSGVSKYDGTNFVNYTVDSGLSNSTVWCSFLDRDSALWYGTSDGLNRFYKGKFERFNTADGLASKRITSIFQDRSGMLWLGTREGLSKYDGETFTTITADQGLDAQNIRSIVEDQAGNLWLGTNNGAFRYDGKTFQNITASPDQKDNNIISILEDGRGNLWFGSPNGLLFYENGQLRTFRLGKEYSSNSVNFLVMDYREHLWLGTDNGVFEVNVQAFYQDQGKELVMEHYTTLDGIRGLECNQNAAYRDSNGNLWFGTNEGVVKYDPRKSGLRDADLLPNVYVTKARLFLEETDWQEYTEEFDSDYGLPQNLKLPYADNYVTIDYVGIFHTNPQKLRYQYRLEGFEENWLPETQTTFATYSNLPPGDYTFMVRARRENGTWGNSAEFSFSVLPPFWQTWWFYSACGLAVFLISYLIYSWRMNVINRRKETQRLKDKSKMLNLEQQTLNAHMNRHFIFNALNSIQYYINRQDRLSANMYLAKFAELVRKNLDSSQVNLVYLSEELERLELYLALENMRFNDKFHYEIKLDEEIDTESIRIPSMMLQPFVENSIRHGILPKNGEGVITVKVKVRHDDLIFTILDNGIGIDTSKKNKGKFQKNHISKGMEITENRIHLMRKMTDRNISIKGPYETKNGSGLTTGTRVDITLPIDFEYLAENNGL